MSGERILTTLCADQNYLSLIQVNERGRKQVMVSLSASKALTIEAIKHASAAITSTKILLKQLEVPTDIARMAMRMVGTAECFLRCWLSKWQVFCALLRLLRLLFVQSTISSLGSEEWKTHLYEKVRSVLFISSTCKLFSSSI